MLGQKALAHAGLAIVEDIAEIWGAELSFETTSQGFTAVLAIPAVAAKRTVVPLAKHDD